MSTYRIIHKWWLFGVYKRYPDGREFIVKWFTTQDDAKTFIESEKEKEQ